MILTSYKNQEQLMKWLSDAIMIEMKKPVDEINVEFVDSCEDLLNTLMGETQLTDKEIQEHVNKIIKKNGSNIHKPKFFRRSKNLIAASISVFIIFLGGITLYAFNPTIKDIILKTLNLEVGQSIDEGGITFTYWGVTTKYNSIEAIIEAENLNILYPRELPDGCYIESIYVMEHNIAIKYTDSSIGLLITYNFNTDQLPNGDEYFINNQKFIIAKYNNRYEAYTIIDQDLYTIRSISEDILFMLINSLE